MDSPLRHALTALANHQSLSEEQTAEVFGVVMSGEATPAQIGGLLLGLRAKGETADELAGATRLSLSTAIAPTHRGAARPMCSRHSAFASCWMPRTRVAC